ncbi:DUF2846 domain-containing protein [Pinirhizobacter soli]|uniref:DUF2846 domain-containing protein n=1 Tax=Pinirhizobacter soli TaxID=2786953 RepID=UPI00202AA89B|nr:DUF2846 domain-containing protein [Pinirhizobacter soli]
MQRIALTLAIATLAGCITHDDTIRDATASRLYLYQLPTDGDATLTFERANGVFGGGCSNAIYIDNKVAGQIEIGERVVFHVPAGNHDVSLEQRGTCSGGKSDVQTSVASGQNVSFALDAEGTAGLSQSAQQAQGAPAAPEAPAPSSSSGKAG